MSNVKVLTGGLVLIVLGLAGGTGWMIYERIQSEVTPHEKATKQDIVDLREEQQETKKDVLELKDQVRLNSTDISTNRKQIAANNAEIGMLKDSQDKLRKDMEAGDEQAKKLHEHQQGQIDELVEQNKDIQERTEKLEKDMASAMDQLKAQGERIDEQEERISELENKDDAHDEELAALREELAELKRQLGLEGDPPSN